MTSAATPTIPAHNRWVLRALLLDGRWRKARGEVVGPDRVEYPRLLAGYRAAHPHTSARATDPIVHFVVTGS